MMCLSLVLCALQLQGQNITLFESDGKNRVEVITDSNGNITCTVYMTSVTCEMVARGETSFLTLHADGCVLPAGNGNPLLPAMSFLLRLPEGCSEYHIRMEREFYEIDLTQFGNAKLFPSQPSILKNEKVRFFEPDEQVYRKNDWIESETVQFEDLGMMRSVHLGHITYTPFAYHPVQNKLRVYTQTVIVIEPIEKINETSNESGYDETPYFSFVNAMTMNGNDYHSKAIISDAPVAYLIITDSMFQDALLPLVQWKTEKGFRVSMATVQDIPNGNTALGIKTYVQSVYDSSTVNHPAPLFLLLAGDIDQVPSGVGATAGHPTDWYYADCTGDILPDLFVGRFSATSAAQIETQVQKTIRYEQGMLPQLDYLENALLVAGSDDIYAEVHGNGQINYIEQNYLTSDEGFVTELIAAPGSATASAQIKTLISSGLCLVNYTGHGNANGWLEPGLIAADTALISNMDMFFLMIGNACSTADFEYAVCFGEAMMRVVDKGAVGYIGATNLTAWNEDYWWAVGVGAIVPNPQYTNTTLGAWDRMFHAHGEPQHEWFVTQSQMIVAGNMSVELSGSSMREYYREIYHLLGDPSLMPYFGIPTEISAVLPDSLPLGSVQCVVETEPYAYVGLSMNGILISAAFSDHSGIADLHFAPLTSIGEATVIVSKQNRVPLRDSIVFVQPDGIVVIPVQIEVNDGSGNGNGQADYSEVWSLNSVFKNVGTENAGSSYAIISTSSPYVTVVEDSIELGLILSGDSVIQSGIFEFQCAGIVPEMESVLFHIIVTDTSGATTSSQTTVVLHTPVYELNHMLLTDTISGNGDGWFVAEEEASLTIHLINSGSSGGRNIECLLSSLYPEIQFNIDSVMIDTLHSSGDTILYFTAELSAFAQHGDVIPCVFNVSDGLYTSTDTIMLVVGVMEENFETDNFNLFPWFYGYGTEQFPWIISDSNPFEGNYCSQSAPITHGQYSRMAVKVEVFMADTLSFYHFESCEPNTGQSYWDYLDFSVDGISKGKWAGNNPWTKASFNILPGVHELMWTYRKDNSISQFDDLVKVDHIEFPHMIQFFDVTWTEEWIVENQQLNIYPNPATENISIVFPANEEGKILLIFTDISGKIVFSRQLFVYLGCQNEYQFTVSDLPSGVYILNVMSQSTIYREKIIIQ